MKWGILATGTIARKFADTVNHMDPEAEKLIACASRNLEHGKAFAEKYGIPKVYGSYGEMMTDSEVEAVYIATPNNLHYENCRMCLEAGKHVLCEKPFTLSTEQAQELFDLAEEKGLFIMEAFWIRFLPAYDKLRTMLRDGVIGEVNRITSQFGFVAEGARRERKFKSELGGGALLDIGIYNLGFFHMITEAAPEGFQSEVHMTEYGTDDYSEIELEYPGGCSGHCIQAIGKQLDRNARIEGSKGVITIADFQFLQEFTVQLKDGTSYIIKEPFKINGFEYEIAETSRCVSRGMCTSDRYTKEDCLAVLRLMDDIRDSWDMIFEAEMENKKLTETKRERKWRRSFSFSFKFLSVFLFGSSFFISCVSIICFFIIICFDKISNMEQLGITRSGNIYPFFFQFQVFYVHVLCT